MLNEPIDARRVLEPEPGVKVRSKIEYLIYRTLVAARERGRLSFAYEQELRLADIPVPIHPDFTIDVAGRRFYWEHLGRLDIATYARDWEERHAAYVAAGLSDNLVTSDDLHGVIQERIEAIVGSLIEGHAGGKRASFSEHHHPLDRIHD